jgi:iron complex outermembrane recepter protein
VTADVDDEQWGINSTLTWDIGGGSSVRMINSYRDWSNEQLDGDVVFTPTPIASRTGLFDSKAQNHELQFISPKEQWLDGRLDLVAGLYYFQEDYSQGERLHMNSQFCAKLAGGHPACNAILANTGGRNATIQDVDQDSTSFAAYAQANFHFTDQLFATVGGRYTDDSKEGRYDQSTNLFLAGVRAEEHLDLPDVDDHRFTYRLGLNYEPTEDHLLFASFSTGYKSAGYNSGAGSPSLTRIPVTPPTTPPTFLDVPERRGFDRETVENFEVGAKTSWLNKALTLNLTLYRMDIKGFQDRAYDGTSFTVRNAGNLRHQGFEFDGVARPMPGLSLFASVAYLDSEFTKYPDAAGLPGCGAVGGAVVPGCDPLPFDGKLQDLKGKSATFAPKWSGRIGLDAYGDIGSSGLSWGFNTNLSFTSKVFGGLVNDANPQTVIDGYALLGARATLNGPGDRWSVSVFGNNLTNKQYETGNFYQFLESSLPVRNGVFAGSTAVRRMHADPRTLGASATFRF